jgi:hypothetical protein
MDVCGCRLLDLSYEIIRTIVSFLSATDVVRLSATCIILSDICNEESLWRELFIKEFPYSYRIGWTPLQRLDPALFAFPLFSSGEASDPTSNQTRHLSSELSNSGMALCVLLTRLTTLTDDDTAIWKEYFIERYRIKRNWKDRRYKMYTLDVHTGMVQ